MASSYLIRIFVGWNISDIDKKSNNRCSVLVYFVKNSILGSPHLVLESRALPVLFSPIQKPFSK